MKLEIGGGFLATLTIIFVIAKLLGYIDWSWWTVFLPAIISIGVTTFIILIVISIVILGAWFT